MAFKFLIHKWQRVTALVVAIFIAIVLILGLLINIYWSPILSSKVKEVVLKSSDGLYRVDFSSAELHVLRGTIIIYNITLKPDTVVYNLQKKNNLAPNNLVELRVKRLTLSHIHPFRLYFQHKLNIGEVVLNEPELNISYQLNHKKDTLLKNNKTAWQKISKSLHSIHIGDILLGDVKLKYQDYSGNKLMKSEFKEMDLSAHDLLIDSATQTDKSRLLYCKEIIVELNNYKGKSPDGLYSYQFDHLKLSTLRSRLNIEGLVLKPARTSVFFAKTTQDRFTARLDSVQLNHFDFLNYHKYRLITASSINVRNGRVEVFGNPRVTPRATDRVATYPNVGLRAVNGDIELDTLRLHHIDVVYNEYNHKSNKTGTVTFHNTSGYIRNITTRQTALVKNNVCVIELTSRFMNEARLNIHLDFNLTDKSNSFAYKGTVGPMALKTLNQATMPLTMVKIQSGTLKQFSFDIAADRSNSHGKVLVLYNDLKVTLLKTDTVMGLKSKPIQSLFANLFILKHDNPDVDGSLPRSYYVNFHRTRDMPFFKFAWKTMLEGIKPAIGLTKKAKDDTEALINQRAINKQNRKIKKEMRQERRAERRKKREEKRLATGGQ